MKRLLAALIVPIVLLSGGTPEAQEKVRFGTGSAISLTTAPLTMAMGMGFFKEEGLDVEVQPFRGGTGVLIPQIVNRSITIGFPTLDVLIQARQPGRDYLPLRFFYNMTRTSIYEVVVLETSPVRRLSDLKGQKVGVGALSWGNIPITKAMFKEEGLEVGKDVELIAVGQGAGAYHALTSGQIGALNLFDVPHADLESLGTKIRRLPLKEKFVNLGSNSLLAHEETIKTQSKMLAAFGRAMAKGTVACDANVAACVRTFWQFYPELKPTQGSEEDKVGKGIQVLRSRLEKMLAFAPGAPQDLGEFPVQMWKEYVDVLHVTGQISTPQIPIDTLYTNHLVPEFNKFDRAMIIRAAKSLK